MKDTVIVLSKEEFLLLAAAAGIRQMYGFSAPDVSGDDQELVLSMQKLAEKNMLVSIEGRFEVLEPVRSLFLQIKDAKTTLDVHKRSGRKCIVYIGDFGVKVSVSQRRPSALEIQKIPNKEIWTHLTEEGWIPQDREDLV